MASTGYHEPVELLSSETREMHRALVSAIEELEAIDWYQQRADAAEDAELKAILLHNKNEEIEHFLMSLEWMRRRSTVFDQQMKKYLFTEGDVTALEDAEEGDPPSDGSLSIGSLREARR